MQTRIAKDQNPPKISCANNRSSLFKPTPPTAPKPKKVSPLTSRLEKKLKLKK